MNKTVTMLLEKETPGAVRYQEVDGAGKKVEQKDSVLGSLYIRKTALNGVVPSSIKVTVEA